MLYSKNLTSYFKTSYSSPWRRKLYGIPYQNVFTLILWFLIDMVPSVCTESSTRVSMSNSVEFMSSLIHVQFCKWAVCMKHSKAMNNKEICFHKLCEQFRAHTDLWSRCTLLHELSFNISVLRIWECNFRYLLSYQKCQWNV